MHITRTYFAWLALVGALTLAMMGGGCGSTSSTMTGDGAVGSCQEGEPDWCDGNFFMTCVDGEWQSENCGLGVCLESMGCRMCRPETRYCSSQDVFECNADGTDRTLVETCLPDEQCVNGGCLSACDGAAAYKSNVGCEFWAVDLPNEYYCQSINGGATCLPTNMGYGCASCQQFAVVVTNTSDFTVHVTAEMNNAAPGDPLDLEVLEEADIQPGLLHLFNLPMREVDCTEWYTDADGRLRRTGDSTTCLTSRAFRVTSTYPVVAYQFNPLLNDFSNGASLLIPTNGLDRDHYVMGWYTANPIAIDIPGNVMEGVPDHMNVTVVGVQPNTRVEIITTHPTQASPDGNFPAAGVGDTVTVDLGPFDVFNLSTHQTMANPTGDLTGTRVLANNPVVVFSGGQRSLVPGNLDQYSPRPPEPSGEYDVCCTEHFEQQMFPVSSLGTKFVLTRTPVRSTGSPEPDFYRILATEPGTVVTTSLTNFPEFNLEPGGVANFWATEDFVVTSSEPIMIAQYAVCQGFLESYSVGGDPEFILFPPIEQYRQDYIFLTPPSFEKDFVIIGAPEGTEVLLDGDDVGGEITTLCESYPAGEIDGVSYKAIRCPVEDGVHTIKASAPVGITVYGYYSVGSYGYPGGADVKEINVQ